MTNFCEGLVREKSLVNQQISCSKTSFSLVTISRANADKGAALPQCCPMDRENDNEREENEEREG